MSDSPAFGAAERSSNDPAPATPATTCPASAASYLPPTIAVIGSLASLTQGGTDFPDDGSGGAGATGSI